MADIIAKVFDAHALFILAIWLCLGDHAVPLQEENLLFCGLEDFSDIKELDEAICLQSFSEKRH